MWRHYSTIEFILATWLVVLTGCTTVPITGREQLNIVPESTLLTTSFQQYEQFLDQHDVVSQGPQAAMVQRVGLRIERAVEDYFAQRNLSGRLAGYRWEFHLVDSPEVNAWAMPGGKVVVYRGMLEEVTPDEAGLAAVIGHEVAHVVAQHGAERMSQALLAQMGGMALSAAISSRPQETQQLWMAAFGAGAQVGVLLPFSRLQESEADHLGLIFMAMAGYDPQAALEVWQRMAARSQGGGVPAFLSTHPTDQKRLAQIRKWLPEAMTYYRP